MLVVALVSCRDEHTCVPLVRSVRSSVTPEGTATLDKTMVEQDVLDLLAEDAPLEPEKVQVVALLSRSGAAVGKGAAAGAATARVEQMMAVKATAPRTWTMMDCSHLLIRDQIQLKRNREK